MIRALPIYTEREPFQVLSRKGLDVQWFTWLPQPKSLFHTRHIIQISNFRSQPPGYLDKFVIIYITEPAKAAVVCIETNNIFIGLIETCRSFVDNLESA